MCKGYIYRHWIVNDEGIEKSYIGQTIQPIQVRHYNHLHQNNYFDRALKKYGESNFTLEILEDNIFDSEELDKKEQYYIEKYNTYYDGYNLTFGGQGKRELFDRKLGKQVVDLLKTTELTYEEIGKQCNCSISTISDINNGYTYIQTDIDYPIRKKPSWYKFGDNEIKLVIYYLQNTKYTHWKIAEITDTNKNFVDDINRGKRKNLPKNIKFPIRDNPKREDINLILAIIYQGFHDYAKMKCGKKVSCFESDPDNIITNISVYNPELIQNIKKKM